MGIVMSAYIDRFVVRSEIPIGEAEKRYCGAKESTVFLSNKLFLG
jgi:hypothetical protein